MPPDWSEPGEHPYCETRFTWSNVTRFLVILGLLVVALYFVAYAHARNDSGEWDHVSPEQRAWFQSVKSPGGIPCCDVADGHRTIWRSAGQGYEVQIDGHWRPVPEEAVVRDARNPTGEAIVWYMAYPDGTVFIRCFVPGAET